MKNQSIREKYAALTVLSQRSLPSATAINKVCFLLEDRLEKPYQATEKGRKKVISDNPLPPQFDGDKMPESIAQKRQDAMDALMEEDTPVRKIPNHMRLRTSDMPKVLTGEGGHKNAEGLAQIRKMLGSLYVREGDELVKDQPDGLENEDESAEVDPMAEHTAKAG